MYAPTITCDADEEPGGKAPFRALEDEDTGGRSDRVEIGEVFIDVEPLAGRGVVFFSGAVEHEVLPVTGEKPRAAVTAWFH